MKKYYLILCMALACTSANLSAQTWIPEDELSYATRYGLDEALVSEEPDSIFAISIWGSNYDPYFVTDSSQVSEDIFKFRNLQILEINDHLAGDVLEHLDRFPMLQVLSLRNAGVANLSGSFYSLKNLKQLELQDMDELKLDGSRLAGNNIHDLVLVRVNVICDSAENCHQPIELFPHLKRFRLGGSEYHIPPGVFGLKEIESLDFTSCNFTEISPEIGKLSTLKELILSSLPELTTLPDEIGQLTALESLDIGGCAFEYLPDGLQHCTALTTIYANYNSLQELPEWIGNLTNLSALSVANCYIKSLPDALKSCASLSSLTAYNNNMEAFPEVLFSIPGISSIDVSNNSITNFPAGLSNLTMLGSLDLSGNPLRNIAPGAFTSSSLTYMSLSRISFGKLPDLQGLTNVYYLDISDDSLAEIPASLFGLKTLRELNLTSNQLQTLPEIGWENLVLLETLSLSYNALNSLPKNLYKAPALYSMDATYNKLTKLPKTFYKCNSLSYLRLQGNKGIVFTKDIGGMKSLSSLQIGPEDLTPKNLAKLKKWLGEEKLEIYEY